MAVQAGPADRLLAWGEREVYPHRLATLRRIADDYDSDVRGRAHCLKRLVECSTAQSVEAYDPAISHDRRVDIECYVDSSPLRPNPTGVPVNRWYLIHILPFAIKDRKDTLMFQDPG
uniref:Uncharacterized protein n=1 Tax=Peronospora matthiolae TaxID=2874970 RepID=A0AAV1TZV3_9STRA